MKLVTERVFAGLCVACFLLSLLATLTQFDAYLAFLEKHLSPDGVISEPVTTLVWLHLALLGIAVLALVTSRRVSWLFAFVVALTAGQRVFYGTSLYCEDGFLETATAVLALITAGWLLVLSISRRDGVHRAFLFSVSFAFFLFGMEEISWGQRLWGWATPEAWASVNFQQETNFHNLLNPVLVVLLFFFNLFMAAVLLSGERVSVLRRFGRIACLLPGATLSHFGYIFLFLAAQCLLFGGEVTELVFSIFGASYAVSLGKRMQADREAKQRPTIELGVDLPPTRGVVRRRLEKPSGVWPT